MSRSFQQITGSEAFKNRREKIAKVIALDYTIDKRRERRQREGEEEGGYGDATRRISTNDYKRRISLRENNAEKQITTIITALEAIENTSYKNLNALT